MRNYVEALSRDNDARGVFMLAFEKLNRASQAHKALGQAPQAPEALIPWMDASAAIQRDYYIAEGMVVGVALLKNSVFGSTSGAVATLWWLHDNPYTAKEYLY